VTFQAALLVRHSPAPVADAFVAGRVRGEHGATFGTLGPEAGAGAVDLLIGRALSA
jgi:putative acyl-CoA dehydrogenase